MAQSALYSASAGWGMSQPVIDACPIQPGTISLGMFTGARSSRLENKQSKQDQHSRNIKLNSTRFSATSRGTVNM